MSGVLAVVTAGLIAGRRGARVLSPNARLMGIGVWSVVLFMINGFAFLLIGVQLPSILDALTAYPPAELIGLGLAISLTVIVARIVWVFPATYVPRWLSAEAPGAGPVPAGRGGLRDLVGGDARRRLARRRAVAADRRARTVRC